MKEKVYLANNEVMLEFGATLSKLFQAGDVIYLYGDLGAGKTTLVKGILRGMGYNGNVKSPTYTLIEEYPFSNFTIFHYDLYRLADPEELEWMGFRDNFDSNAISFIEWPEKGGGYLPLATKEIFISYQDEGRIVEIKH